MGPTAITEAEVISIFLKAEIDSPRFGARISPLLAQLKVGREIIDSPDLESVYENQCRATILGSYRGFGQNAALFTNFPRAVKWQRIQLDQSALEQIRYVDCPPWRELSGGTLLIADAANRIRAGTAENQNTAQIIKYIRETAHALKNGVTVAEVILTSQTDTGQRIAIEGHNRLTAYLLNGITSPISAIVGVASDLTPWLAVKWS